MSVDSVKDRPVSTATSLGATFNSQAVTISDRLGFSIACLVTGTTPAGTFKLQWSNDGVNFDDITSQTRAITDVGYYVFNVSACYTKWVRLVYTRTSGTGAVTAVLSSKN